ncbi:hypothetical protein INT43_007005 [Umbelopsis isabellina]|uniref:Uncharacterized protein n=1 Tax=Mortierella isabellina TaxID=91625 RepID=A0A8H7UJH2_MORIS|nr:hypothetical protein INT43_007005 [Umbelopsis isabellina]
MFQSQDQGELVVWGYDPVTKSKSNKVIPFDVFGANEVVKVYGDPSTVMGIINADGDVFQCAFEGNNQPIRVATGLSDQKFEISSSSNTDPNHDWDRVDGSVYEMPLTADVPSKIEKLDIPPVHCMVASQHHALLYTDTPKAIYGLGSNRFAQLGSPEPSSVSSPQVITFFEGLDPQDIQLNCGISHSAIVLDQDLYTCGLRNDGRLGSGKEHDEAKGYPHLAVFKDKHGELCDVQVVKAACGSMHTVAVDSRCYVLYITRDLLETDGSDLALGRLWGCGSNKYGQVYLGPKAAYEMNSQYVFQEIPTDFNGSIIDCWAGHWNTFLQSTDR